MAERDAHSDVPVSGSSTGASPAPPPASLVPLSPRRHIPNMLTMLRVVLACGFFAVLSRWSIVDSPIMHSRDGGGSFSHLDWTLIGAAAIFLLAAVTDALDGYLARRWKVVSVFGRIMDPFADKLLVIGAFVFLAGPGFTYGVMAPAKTGALLEAGREQAMEIWYWSVSGVQPWMVALILGRELLVTSIRGVFEGRGVSFAASWSGKFKMILQCICVPGVLLLLNVPLPADGTATGWAWRAIQILVGLTVFVTAWSGMPYITRAIAEVRSARPEQS
ncbi:MAG: CDP-alcohol phosphatidyltransferase family protein [Pyrinomonadaceae bacterium]|nr:CDP-alcohol phosphatidyltransferase family protein [Phycisphaerales bacterium]